MRMPRTCSEVFLKLERTELCSVFTRILIELIRKSPVKSPNCGIMVYVLIFFFSKNRKFCVNFRVAIESFGKTQKPAIKWD